MVPTRLCWTPTPISPGQFSQCSEMFGVVVHQHVLTMLTTLGLSSINMIAVPLGHSPG